MEGFKNDDYSGKSAIFLNVEELLLINSRFCVYSDCKVMVTC